MLEELLNSPIFSFVLGAFLLPEKACRMSCSFFSWISSTRDSTVSSATSWKTRTLRRIGTTLGVSSTLATVLDYSATRLTVSSVRYGRHDR